MPTGKINTWSVKLRDGPDGHELPGFVVIGEEVDVKVDNGLGWLLVVAQIDGDRRLGFLDGCYVLLEPEPLPPAVPVAPQGGFGFDVVRAAQEANRKFTFPASVTLAQWGLESDFGRLTPSDSNNPFRIKSVDDQEKVKARTKQSIEKMRTYAWADFRKYNSLAEAVDDHVRSMVESPGYLNARLALPDPLRFIDVLAEIGGREPSYSAQLRELIRTYKLAQFD
jgi:hypothetical protein